MQALNFDYRDILKAPRLAWSIRKMYISFRGILIAWGIYLVFSYIALFFTPAKQEVGIIELFRHFEFFPCVLPANPGILAYFIWGIGIVLALFMLLITATSVARIAFEDLRGNEVFQVKEALQFGRTHGVIAVISIVVLGFLVIFFPLIFGLFGALGRIPVLGELLIAFLSLPLFFWGLLGAFVFIVFMFGFVLVPAITACTGEDVLELIIQTFSSVFKQPLRLIIYEIATKIVVIISSVILAVVSLLALHVMYVTMGLCMGYTFSKILTIALYRIPFVMESHALVTKIIELGELLGIPYIVDTGMVSTTVQVAGWIFGISQLLIFAWILSYFFSGLFSSQVLIYLAIRKHKNGDDLRQRNPVTHFVPESPKSNANSG